MTYSHRNIMMNVICRISSSNTLNLSRKPTKWTNTLMFKWENLIEILWRRCITQSNIGVLVFRGRLPSIMKQTDRQSRSNIKVRSQIVESLILHHIWKCPEIHACIAKSFVYASYILENWHISMSMAYRMCAQCLVS